ncbi:RecQ family ATP-dependent DNA helicase [Sinomonas terrae]|uniref:ATP-dependent DNA helicase RecQ n=1 Tax=Sinomonas terrae TaxID=2908838 RepID=A0ABS9U1B2_9MICC|nr:RecQ family ATP-dependent DNA helicase [Sinomonas terrae]MCH6470466.1 RecQ family ATP-dependent DNA helicase [Sinomonas terrae]
MTTTGPHQQAKPEAAPSDSEASPPTDGSASETGSATPSAQALGRIATEQFGIDAWREGQFEALVAAVEGRDVLAVMPTGHGKSLIYQIPGAALPGVTVVVSPLIALQRDQAEAINERLGDGRAVALNSAVGARAVREAWAALDDGGSHFVFLAPEQLAREETIERLAALDIRLFVVDEAHCISSWGHDFRPDYLFLGDVAQRLGAPPVIALTATASPHTRSEIVERLRLRDPLELVQSFDRPNVELRVIRHAGDLDKRQAVLDEVTELRGPGLLYVATRRVAEEYADELSQRGLRAEAYHAGRRAADRTAVHERFLDNQLDVVVATTAFGMGIDKPDVRFVVHADIPDSLDSYYQEIGRAGRDGGSAIGILHYRSEDLGLQRFFAGRSFKQEDVEAVFRAVRDRGPLRAAALRRETELGPRALSRALNLLEHSGGVLGASRGYRAAPVMSSERAVELAQAEDESRQRIDESRVEMARGYAETGACRRHWLLNYFGEEADAWCGNCDNCLQEGSAEKAEEREAATPDEWSLQTPVRHREWGPGLVMSVEPDRITVLFESVGYKELALAVIDENEDLLVREDRPE